jgi:iron complex transport system substrate-binding protein
MRKRLSSTIALLLLLTFVVTLVPACGGSTAAPTATTAPLVATPTAPAATPMAVTTTAPTVAPTTAPTVATTKTIVDSDGTTVVIPANPTKIAALRAPHIELLCALGAEKKISMVDSATQKGNSFGAFPAAAWPDLQKLPTADVNGSISMEELIKNNPDVIIQGGTSRAQIIADIRKQTTIPLVAVHLETFDKYMNDVRILAQVVNAEARGEELVKIFQDELDFVAGKVKDVPEGQKVRTFYGVFDVYHAYGANNFEDSQIKAGGGVNVAADTTGWAPEVSAEQLITWDPEVIIIGHYGSDYKLDTVMNDPKLADISAVKNKRVYLLPDPDWEFMSPSALFGVEWVGSVLYPDKFKDVDILADANKFYQSVYGVNYIGPWQQPAK